ncbi:MAG: cytochrome c biogenesis protein CcdA [Chloroflexi bacterium]|nr:cytochrome c biogenesis protein CcdA [Chloroflexota bacterium]
MELAVEAAVAFAGGLLALLSPCSALLLPAFFAYAFGSTGRLVARTAIFYAGLVALLVPVGLGLGALGAVVLERRTELALVAGVLLMAIGLYQLIAGGFEIPGTASLLARVSGESAGATFALGAVYGIAGFCAGPILGGVLTLAGTSGGPITGGTLLAVYAAGIAAPLFVLALLWDRVGLRGRRRLRGREVRIGPWARHSSVVASSLVFVALGVAFIAFQGSSALSGLYADLGAADLAVSLESGAAALIRGNGPIVTLAIAVVAAAAVGAALRSRRRGR